MKQEAKNIVEQFYHLTPDSLDNAGTSNTHRTIARDTKDRVAYLLRNYRFLYGEFQGVSVNLITASMFVDVPPAP
jgi:hypothetical protein